MLQETEKQVMTAPSHGAGRKTTTKPLSGCLPHRRAIIGSMRACAIRALDLIGKHKSVNAFKETESDRQPIDQDWRVTVVYTTRKSICML